MRKINLSNESKRDAEVAFGTTFHRATPVYKTVNGKRSQSQRSVRATLATSAGKVAYGVILNEHVFLPDGTEKEVRPDSTTEANIAVEGSPVRWTGKLIPREKAMRMFVFKKSYQIQHINGLTFDFLYDMAKKLADANAMMLVGGGPKGIAPLVMGNGGTPDRAFREGRVDGDRYALILRLTNLELKPING